MNPTQTQGSSTSDTPNKAERLNNIAIRSLPQNVRCRRNPKNDECSGCGSCCARVLPLFPSEVKRIVKYLKDHVEIMDKVLSLNAGMTHVMCPFLDFTKPSHQCMIYDSGVLPAICKCYTCNPEKKNAQLRRMLEERAPKTPTPYVDMWHTFFFSATRAPDISRAWFLKEIVKLSGNLPVYPGTTTVVTVEDLPKYFETYPWVDFFTNCCSPQVKLPPLIKTDKEAINWYLDLFKTLKKQNRIRNL